MPLPAFPLQALSPAVIGASLIGVLVLLSLLQVLVWPLRFLADTFLRFAVGVALLWLLNYGGGFVDFHVALNPVTALVTGYLGAPGLAVLVVLTHFW